MDKNKINTPENTFANRIFRPFFSSCWGILIDTRAKTFKYLDEDWYFLSLDEQGRIIPEKKESNDTLFTIGKQKYSFTIKDRKDDIALWAALKTGPTYTYWACIVPPGEEIGVLDWKKYRNQKQCERIRGRDDDYQETEIDFLRTYQAIYHSSNGAHFRIIPIIPNLEPDELQNKKK